MTRPKEYLGNLIINIVNSHGPTEAYFLVVGLCVAIGIVAMLAWYVIFYITGNKKKIPKQDLQKGIIILAVLIIGGWLLIPVFGNWMWSYGTKGMPPIEDNNSRINEILQNTK